MQFSLLQSDSDKWNGLLSRTIFDFYHLPSYVELEAERNGGRAGAALVEDGAYFLLLPLVFRPVKILGEAISANEGLMDAVSPYGYPGPIVIGPKDDHNCKDFVYEAVKALKKGLAAASIICMFVRMHPLLMPPAEEEFGAAGELVKHGDTVWVDLTRDPDEIWLQTRTTYRNLIRRMERNGFSASINCSQQGLECFCAIYRNTMERLQCEEFYYFGDEYFTKLKSVLGSSLHLCLVEHEGHICAAGLFTESCGFVQYHLSGCDSAPAYRDSPKLMLNYMINWAKERGDHTFHLGGGLGCASDNLFFFKSGFSKKRASFYTWRVVTNPSAYEFATQLHKERANPKSAVQTVFFPSYRA